MNKRWYWLFFAMFAIVALLPPVLHGDKLLIINNDTANHIIAFESIKGDNPQFLYLGQKVVGYSLIWLEQLTRIDLATLFMWFNFLVILLGGIAIAALIIITTKSWLGGIISAVLITFGLGSTQHLFWSGTIFNLIEYLILLPVLLICFYFTTKKASLKLALPALVGTGILTFFFHPSLGKGISYIADLAIHREGIINPVVALMLFFGITNLLLFIPCWLGIKSNAEKTEVATKIIFGIIVSLFVVELFLSTLNLTPFSSRMIINAFLLLGIALCFNIGIALKSKSRIVKWTIVSLVGLGILPNLINWFTWTSFYNPTRGMY